MNVKENKGAHSPLVINHPAAGSTVDAPGGQYTIDGDAGAAQVVYLKVYNCASRIEMDIQPAADALSQPVISGSWEFPNFDVHASTSSPYPENLAVAWYEDMGGDIIGTEMVLFRARQT